MVGLELTDETLNCSLLLLCQRILLDIHSITKASVFSRCHYILRTQWKMSQCFMGHSHTFWHLHHSVFCATAHFRWRLSWLISWYIPLPSSWSMIQGHERFIIWQQTVHSLWCFFPFGLGPITYSRELSANGIWQFWHFCSIPPFSYDGWKWHALAELNYLNNNKK